MPHLLTNFRIWTIYIIVHQLRFWHLVPVAMSNLLANLRWACSNGLLQAACTLAVTHLLALVGHSFGSGEFVGLAQIIAPRLLLHDQVLTLLVPIHLRWIGHPDLVECGSLTYDLAFHFLVDRRVDWGAQILWRIQFVLVDVQREVECLHNRGWNILDFRHSWNNLRCDKCSFLHLSELLVSLIDNNIETIIKLEYLLLVCNSQIVNVSLMLSYGILNVLTVVAGRHVVRRFLTLSILLIRLLLFFAQELNIFYEWSYWKVLATIWYLLHTLINRVHQ